jgi:hypothetical protein
VTRRSARWTGNGLIPVLAFVCLPIVSATWILMTQPKEWTRGVIVLGRANCSTPCRLRGGLADLLGPKEAPHCLCGRARTHW